MYIKVFHNGFAGSPSNCRALSILPKLDVPRIMVINLFINRQVLLQITDIAPVPVHVAQPLSQSLRQTE